MAQRTPADPDLLAILDKGSNRIVDTLGDESAVASGSTPTPKGGGRSATPGSPAHDKRNDVVVDVKENDMASGPSRRHMKQPPNSLR
ncbi:hypothetical protein HPB50_022313 [Hyalomma asiaticum]|uniref:Uncharacterized protein n=1 Tax=Hyalomma asiaticum TaxID=266040 RepID=A0ACB7S5L5_HYAAI|nr:hypothetical protein HPB50_022313 [Hyalomma asiaticum]